MKRHDANNPNTNACMRTHLCFFNLFNTYLQDLMMAKVTFPSYFLQKEIKNESMATRKNTQRQNTKNHNFGSNSFDHQFQ